MRCSLCESKVTHTHTHIYTTTRKFILCGASNRISQHKFFDKHFYLLFFLSTFCYRSIDINNNLCGVFEHVCLCMRTTPCSFLHTHTLTPIFCHTKNKHKNCVKPWRYYVQLERSHNKWFVCVYYYIVNCTIYMKNLHSQWETTKKDVSTTMVIPRIQWFSRSKLLFNKCHFRYFSDILMELNWGAQSGQIKSLCISFSDLGSISRHSIQMAMMMMMFNQPVCGSWKTKTFDIC